MVYGTSGVGKTRLLESANNSTVTGPALFIDCEGGQESLVGSSIEILRVGTLKQLQSALNDMAKAIDKGTFPFKAICIDSLSEVYGWALNDAITSDGRRADDSQPEQRDYFTAMRRMRKLVKFLRDLPIHVVMSALLSETTDPREGLLKQPMFPGQFKDEVGGVLDVMGFMSMQLAGDKTVRRLTVSPQKGIRAKFRTALNVAAPVFIDSPTVEAIVTAMRGN